MKGGRSSSNRLIVVSHTEEGENFRFIGAERRISVNERHTSRKRLKVSEPEMRSEYDFSRAVRGKYYRRYLESSNVVIEPDVHRKFKNSAAVNDALRTLIRAAGKGRGLTKRPTRTRAKAARAGGR